MNKEARKLIGVKVANIAVTCGGKSVQAAVNYIQVLDLTDRDKEVLTAYAEGISVGRVCGHESCNEGYIASMGDECMTLCAIAETKELFDRGVELAEALAEEAGLEKMENEQDRRDMCRSVGNRLVNLIYNPMMGHSYTNKGKEFQKKFESVYGKPDIERGGLDITEVSTKAGRGFYEGTIFADLYGAEVQAEDDIWADVISFENN